MHRRKSKIKKDRSQVIVTTPSASNTLSMLHSVLTNIVTLFNNANGIKSLVTAGFFQMADTFETYFTLENFDNNLTFSPPTGTLNHSAYENRTFALPPIYKLSLVSWVPEFENMTMSLYQGVCGNFSIVSNATLSSYCATTYYVGSWNDFNFNLLGFLEQCRDGVNNLTMNSGINCTINLINGAVDAYVAAHPPIWNYPTYKGDPEPDPTQVATASSSDDNGLVIFLLIMTVTAFVGIPIAVACRSKSNKIKQAALPVVRNPNTATLVEESITSSNEEQSIEQEELDEIKIDISPINKSVSSSPPSSDQVQEYNKILAVKTNNQKTWDDLTERSNNILEKIKAQKIDNADTPLNQLKIKIIRDKLDKLAKSKLTLNCLCGITQQIMDEPMETEGDNDVYEGFVIKRMRELDMPHLKNPDRKIGEIKLNASTRSLIEAFIGEATLTVQECENDTKEFLSVNSLENKKEEAVVANETPGMFAMVHTVIQSPFKFFKSYQQTAEANSKEEKLNNKDEIAFGSA